MSRQSKFASWQQLKAAEKFKPLEHIKVEPVEKPKVEPTLGELLVSTPTEIPIDEPEIAAKPIKKITKKTTEE